MGDQPAFGGGRIVLASISIPTLNQETTIRQAVEALHQLQRTD